MKILVLGSGPERVGKTGELDRMADRAIELLTREGYQVVYLDSNPVSMASVNRAGVTVYMEPLMLSCIENIIEKEKPDGIIHCFGGLLASHLIVFLDREGILGKFGVRILGTPVSALKLVLEEEIFKKTLSDLGIPSAELKVAHSIDAAVQASRSMGFPLFVRASFASEGSGGYLAYNADELKEIAPLVINMSPVREIVLNRIKDSYIQVVIECLYDTTLPEQVFPVGTFESLDVSYGIHLGNTSIISPSITLKGDLLQKAMGIATVAAKHIGLSGYFEVRFWYYPNTGELVVHRLIPCQTRFSSLCSIANGIPLTDVNVALCLETGLKDDLICNLPSEGLDQEASLGRVQAIRIPLFSDEIQKTGHLSGVMHSTGARIFLGSSTEEAIGKAVDSAVTIMVETATIFPIGKLRPEAFLRILKQKLFKENEDMISQQSEANPAFLYVINGIIKIINELESLGGQAIPPLLMANAKRCGFSNKFISFLTGQDIEQVQKECKHQEVLIPSNHVRGKQENPGGMQLSFFSRKKIKKEERAIIQEKFQERRPAILMLGSGPYTIGWGSEIDQAMVQTASKLKMKGWSLVLINDNPDGISIESDVFDAVYVETVTKENLEALFNVYPISAIIHQFSPHIPIGFERIIDNHNINVIGTPLKSLKMLKKIHMLWQELERIGITLMPYKTLTNKKEIVDAAERMGYPLLVRLTDKYINPGANIVYDEKSLNRFLSSNQEKINKENPIFMEKFQEGLIGAEVLAVGDGEDAHVFGFLENVEEYGVHNDDCASIIPTLSVGDYQLSFAEEAMKRIVAHFGIIGHIKLWLAIKGREVYITGFFPYPSRNISFTERVFHQPLHEWVAHVLADGKISELNDSGRILPRRFYVKEAVFPFKEFSHLDPMLTPQMASIGQVMGQNNSFGKAFIKAQIEICPMILRTGTVFLSGRDTEKEAILQIAKKLIKLGFHLVSTQGTAHFLLERGIKVEGVYKVSERRPNVLDMIKNDKISLVINIPGGFQSRQDEEMIRRATIGRDIPLVTTISGALLMVRGIEELNKSSLSFMPLYKET